MAKPVGLAPDYDAYQQYLDGQRAAKLAELAAGGAAKAPMTPTQEGFQLSQPFSMQPVNDTTAAHFDNTLQLDKGFDSATPAQYQDMSSPSMSIGSGVVDAGSGGASAGSMAGAGIAAAGQAVSIIAQLAGQKAAQDSTIAQNTINRDSSARMARAALSQDASQFDSTSQMSAYANMLSMLNGAADQTMQQRALNRANSQNRGDGLTTAFLGA